MGHDVGIWIDHKRAVFVRVRAEGITTETVESQIAARVKAHFGTER